MFNISFASFRDWGATPRGYVLNTILRVLCHVGMTYRGFTPYHPQLWINHEGDEKGQCPLF